jgi:hypothetical protein
MTSIPRSNYSNYNSRFLSLRKWLVFLNCIKSLSIATMENSCEASVAPMARQVPANMHSPPVEFPGPAPLSKYKQLGNLENVPFAAHGLRDDTISLMIPHVDTGSRLGNDQDCTPFCSNVNPNVNPVDLRQPLNAS